MNYAVMKFGKMQVYMPADASLDINRGINKTSASSEKIKASLQDALASIAGSLGDQLTALKQAKAPAEVSLELSLGFSAEMKAWVIGGKADHGIKLRLLWKGDAAKA